MPPALGKAEVEGYIRPFHDRSSLTNAADAGTSPGALMARGGHADMQTTMLYVDLAGECFRDDAELLEQRQWGSSTKGRYQVEGETEDAAAEVAAVED